MFTKADLRAFKKGPHELAKAQMFWSHPELVFLVDSNLFIGKVQVAAGFEGEQEFVPILGMERDDNGRLAINLVLREKGGPDLVTIQNNDLIVDPRVQDFRIDVGGSDLRAWVPSRKLSLAIEYARVHISEFVHRFGPSPQATFEDLVPCINPEDGTVPLVALNELKTWYGDIEIDADNLVSFSRNGVINARELPPGVNFAFVGVTTPRL